MKKIFSYTLVLCSSVFFTVSTYAQSEVFKVLASRGKNTLSDGSTVVAGKKLSASDILKVGENSYIGLIHSSGKTHEIKVAGTYKVSDLSAQVLAKSSSVSKKYSDYVVGELTKAEGGDIHANYQKNMKITGSVERAISTASISVCLPKKSSIIENQNTITWYKNPKATKYLVEFQDMTEEPIFKTETTDTTLTFDYASFKIKLDNTIMVIVKGVTSSGELTSENYVLQFVKESKNPELYQDKEMLKNEYKEESALNYLMKASFYAQNNLFLDAKKCYESAIRLEPSIKEYKIAYMNFLTKNNLLDFYPYEKQ